MLNILIAGKAGEGIKKSGSVIAQYLSDIGYYVFQYDDYQSVIKGGHNFSMIKASTEKVYSHDLEVDIAFFTNDVAYTQHQSKLKEHSICLINSADYDDFSTLLKISKLDDSYIGLVSIVSILFCLNRSAEQIEEVIKKSFKKKIDENLLCMQTVLEYLSRSNFPKYNEIQITESKSKGSLFSGNMLICLGLLASGLDYYVSYPMTPASSLLHYLASQRDRFGIAVQHAESEIAAINMAIGATFSGARSAVGTSGGGLALMTEGISLAGMTESPVLCVVSSRPGPATGMSTYTAQADLHYVIHCGHGDFSKIVASPHNFEKAYYLSAELMNLAWKFQIPCFLLTEKHLSESSANTDIIYDQTCNQENTQKIDNESTYKRYSITDNGISPLHFPPSEAMIKWNSNEHLENGVRTDDEVLALQMADKRYRKHLNIKEYIKNHIQSFETTIFNAKPDNTYDFSIISYGSTGMSIKEALKSSEFAVQLIEIIYLEPFPAEAIDQLLNKEFIVIEQSMHEQFADLIRFQTGKRAFKVIKSYDGRPFDPKHLYQQIEECFHEITDHR